MVNPRCDKYKFRDKEISYILAGGAAVLCASVAGSLPSRGASSPLSDEIWTAAGMVSAEEVEDRVECLRESVMCSWTSSSLDSSIS